MLCPEKEENEAEGGETEAVDAEDSEAVRVFEATEEVFDDDEADSEGDEIADEDWEAVVGDVVSGVGVGEGVSADAEHDGDGGEEAVLGGFFVV